MNVANSRNTKVRADCGSLMAVDPLGGLLAQVRPLLQPPQFRRGRWETKWWMLRIHALMQNK